MLALALLTALVLLAAFALTTWRALNYIGHHPELLTNEAPPAYARCQQTLLDIIARYQQLEAQPAQGLPHTWQAPSGLFYDVSGDGITERRESAARSAHYALRWQAIGGVGLRMQPGFKLVDRDGDGSPDSQFTVDYTVYLLVVPHSGRTMNVPIPTNRSDDAITFVARTLALAHHQRRRISVFGFDKPPAPYRQRLPKT